MQISEKAENTAAVSSKHLGMTYILLARPWKRGCSVAFLKEQGRIIQPDKNIKTNILCESLLSQKECLNIMI